MPQKYPPMQSHIHADIQHRVITVVVEHDKGQSFSKAVIPKGRKEFRRWVSEHVVFGALQEFSHSLAWHDTPDGARCLSVLRYGY